MTTSRMNSHGKSVAVLARRIERRKDPWVDRRNEAATRVAVATGAGHAIILHPTKGYRRVSVTHKRPVVSVRGWWERFIHPHMRRA